VDPVRWSGRVNCIRWGMTSTGIVQRLSGVRCRMGWTAEKVGDSVVCHTTVRAGGEGGRSNPVPVVLKLGAINSLTLSWDRVVR